MLKKFVPNLYIENFEKLPIEVLLKNNIKTLLCDVDNTLVAHTTVYPTQKVFEFLERLQKNNIQLIMISNNNEERVRCFSEKLNVPYYSFSTKPLKKNFIRAMKEHRLKEGETAMLGDQLLTDILGANRMNLLSILTKPLVTQDLSFTKINRVFESLIYAYLASNNILKKGEYKYEM